MVAVAIEIVVVVVICLLSGIICNDVDEFLQLLLLVVHILFHRCNLL